MGNIIVSTNASLDGIVEDPDGKEGTAAGGWFENALGGDREAWAKHFVAEAMRAEALLLGRRSEAWFGSRWVSRTGPWADRLNALPKYVVSRTLAEPTWTNGRIMRGDAATEVTHLKQEVRGEIAIYASYQLVHALMQHGLVDEFRVVVFPVVVGAGKRLFGEGTHALRLAGNERLGDGLVLLTYRRA